MRISEGMLALLLVWQSMPREHWDWMEREASKQMGVPRPIWSSVEGVLETWAECARRREASCGVALVAWEKRTEGLRRP